MRDLSRSLVAVVILSSWGCQMPSTESEKRQPPAQLAGSVTIYRDAWGVPHVHGPTDASAAFGFAYAQAEDNFWQVEDNFIRATGRAAEIHGETALVDDWLNRALEIPRLAVADYEAARPEVRDLCTAFAAGLNYFLDRNPQVRPRLLTRFEPWHPMALIRTLYYQRGFLRGTGLPAAAFVEAVRREGGLEVAEVASTATAATDFVEGSNSWAITPARSATGHAMLFINPHLPFFGPSQVYEGHVLSDEGWNFSGYTRLGFPLPYVGFNPRLAWASTDNYADLQDVYVETFDHPDDPLAYRYGSGYRTATVRTETLKVRTPGGVAERSVTFRKTHHGPIVAIQDGRPLAVRMAKFDQSGWLDQWHAMTRARSLDEFRAAVAPLAMLFGNYLYADREGNVFYAYNAAVPRRSPDFDWTAPVDGSDPATEWQGYHPMAELPQLLNPATGWLQNCNSTPFLSTSEGNPDPEDYPPYMVREGDTARARGARRLLASRERFTFEEWMAASYDTYVIEAEDDVAELVAEWEELADPAVAEAVALLRGWDRVSTTESEAMSLYVVWRERRTKRRRERGQEAGRNVRALAEAVAELARDWGTWRVPWGELNRLQRVHTGGEEPPGDARPSLPIAGAPTWAGATFTFWSRPFAGQKRRYGWGGNSYVSVVELADPPRARSLHAFGPSADPESAHHFDQAERYARGEYKPAWLTLSDVKANAVRAYHPGR